MPDWYYCCWIASPSVVLYHTSFRSAQKALRKVSALFLLLVMMFYALNTVCFFVRRWFMAGFDVSCSLFFVCGKVSSWYGIVRIFQFCCSERVLLHCQLGRYQTSLVSGLILRWIVLATWSNIRSLMVVFWSLYCILFTCPDSTHLLVYLL